MRGTSLTVTCLLLPTHHMREHVCRGALLGNFPLLSSSEQKHSYRGGHLKISTSKAFGPTSCPSYSIWDNYFSSLLVQHLPCSLPCHRAGLLIGVLHNPLYESHRTVMGCYGVGHNSRQSHLQGQKLLLPFFALLSLEEMSNSDKSTVTDMVHFIFYCSYCC